MKGTERERKCGLKTCVCVCVGEGMYSFPSYISGLVCILVLLVYTIMLKDKENFGLSYFQPTMCASYCFIRYMFWMIPPNLFTFVYQVSYKSFYHTLVSSEQEHTTMWKT